jgi:hypothetical protein
MKHIVPALAATGDICARSSRVQIRTQGDLVADGSFEDDLAAALVLDEALAATPATSGV